MTKPKFMTDLDLRSIAEILKAKFSYSSTAKAKNRFMVCDTDVATLLDAVVEERQKYIALKKFYEIAKELTREELDRLNKQALALALDELNLKDVWTGKEK